MMRYKMTDKKVININISKSFWDSFPSELTINIDTLPVEKVEEKKEEKKEEKVPTKEEESEKALREMFEAISAIGRAASTGSSSSSMKTFLDLMQACGAQVNYGSVSAKPPYSG